MKKTVGVVLVLLLIFIFLLPGYADNELIGTWLLVHYYDEDGNDQVDTPGVEITLQLTFDTSGQMTMYRNDEVYASSAYEYFSDQSIIIVEEQKIPILLEKSLLTIYDRDTMVFQRVSEEISVSIRDDPQVDAMMTSVEKIGAVTDDLWAYLDSQGVDDYYGETGLSLARDYLKSRTDIQEVMSASGGLAFRTDDGWLGGFFSSEYEKGFMGTGTVSMEDALEAHLNDISLVNANIDTLSTMTNSNVRLLVFNSADWNMNAIRNFDTPVLQDYAERNNLDFSSATDTSALRALQNGTYANSGLLVIASHGTYVNGLASTQFWGRSRTFFEVGIFTTGSLPGEFNQPEFKSIHTDYYDPSDLCMFSKIKGTDSFSLKLSADMLERWGANVRFDNTVVILGICYSNRDSTLPQFFLDHGAKAVITCQDEGSIYQHFNTVFTVTYPQKFIYNGDDATAFETPEEAVSVQNSFNDLRDPAIRHNYARAITTLYPALDPGSEDSSSFQSRLLEYWWNESVIVKVGKRERERGPLILRTADDEPRYVTGDGILSCYFPEYSGARISLLRWMNHRFSPLEYRTDQIDSIGRSYFEHLPYGVYGVLIQQGNETIAFAVEHCNPVTELQSNRIIGNVVFGHFSDPFSDGEGYTAWMRGYLLDQNNHLILDRHAEPVHFYIGETHCDWADTSTSEYKSIERVWKLDDTTLFWEHIDPWSIPGAKYTVLRLNNEGEFINELTVEGFGIDGVANCYIMGELVETLPYAPGNLEALRNFLLDVDVDFGDWDEVLLFNTDTYERDLHNRVVRARPLGDDIELILDTEQYADYLSIVRPNDEALTRWYQPENVREITIIAQDSSATATLTIDRFLTDLRGDLAFLTLTSTSKWLDDNNTWQEIYTSVDGYILSISCYPSTGHIAQISLDDTTAYDGWLFQKDPPLFQISAPMQSLINTIVSSESINLDQTTRDTIADLDLATEGVTFMQDDFGSEFKSSVTVSGVTFQVYKFLQLAGMENFHSQITITFTETSP